MRRDFGTWVASYPASPAPRFRLIREDGTTGVADGVRREPISKSCEITQADNLNRRRRLSRKAQ
jgi:hypothetical protein